MSEPAPYTAPDIAILVAAYEVLSRRLVAADDAADVAYYGEYAIAALRPVLWGLTGNPQYTEESDLEPPPRPLDHIEEMASNVIVMPTSVQAETRIIRHLAADDA